MGMTDTQQSQPHSVAPAWLFGVTILVSACLLFLVQPLASKMILPVFGGSSSIWITCLLFFQAVLLLGYLYAHALVSWLTPRWQVRAHIFALGASLVALPILPDARWHPQPGHDPVWGIFGLLATSVGFPYLMLSTTSPLLQSWFSRSRGGELPYHYFAISNLGSLVALFSFPLLIETHFLRREQAVDWSAAYAIFVVLCAALAWMSRNLPDAQSLVAAEAKRKTSPLELASWIVLPGCASLMLMATTSLITENLAPMPMVWILPLGVYLLSFIFCFAPRSLYSRWVFLPLLPAAIGGYAICLGAWRHEKILFTIPLLVASLFVGCMALHGETVRLRPEPARLTGFYLCLSAGGVLGGAAVALVAPHFFRAMYEYVALLFLCPLLVTLALVAHRRHWTRPGLAYAGVALFASLSMAAAAYGTSEFRNDLADSVLLQRNFYGAVQVYPDPDTDFPALVLCHGVTIHGVQFEAINLRDKPTTYYANHSGIGLTYSVLADAGPIKMGVIGLGTGTLAAYGRKGDEIRYYEIDPKIIAIAHKQFTYLGDSKAKVSVVEGDARLTLASEPDQKFDILVVDAFSSDAIPTHLLTREAFQLYWRHLKPDGVLAMHVSNRYLDLPPIVQLGNDGMGKELWEVISSEDEEEDTEPYNATYVLVSSRKDLFSAPEFSDRLSPIEMPKTPLKMWTDEYTTLWPILHPKGEL